MHPLIIEASPAIAAADRALAVSFHISTAIIFRYIMFARHAVDFARAERAMKLIDRVELFGLGQMRQVAGVQHEGGPLRQRVDLGDGLAIGLRHVPVRVTAEAQVAVADLDEREARRRRRLFPVRLGFIGFRRDWRATRDAAAHRPNHAGAGPSHAL